MKILNSTDKKLDRAPNDDALQSSATPMKSCSFFVVSCFGVTDYQNSMSSQEDGPMLTRTMNKMFDIDVQTPFAGSTGTSSFVKSMMPMMPSTTEMTLSRAKLSGVRDIDKAIV